MKPTLFSIGCRLESHEFYYTNDRKILARENQLCFWSLIYGNTQRLTSTAVYKKNFYFFPDAKDFYQVPEELLTFPHSEIYTAMVTHKRNCSKLFLLSIIILMILFQQNLFHVLLWRNIKELVFFMINL